MATHQKLLRQSQKLALTYPWVSKPFIVSAPMKIFSGAELAVAVSSHGGLGFIGPTAKPSDLENILENARGLLPSTLSDKNQLPIGVGFQTWDADLDIAVAAIEKFQPCAAWLFAPRNGQEEFNDWIRRIRSVSSPTQIWIQVGTLREAIATVQAPKDVRPDVLVIQGTDAGGHGRADDGLGLTTLLPEISDALGFDSELPLIAAGGIADGRGVASALGLGAVGVAMGTRFLASSEANIKAGYQNEIIRASDGAHSTVRTTLYNELRGTIGWPEGYNPRTIINQSWIEHKAGVDFRTLQQRHDEATKQGDQAWGPDGRLATYAGTCIGLIHEVKSASAILEDSRQQAIDIMKSMAKLYS
ncbi:Hypothetical protein R9X50_00434200 [Acrodontium crateriforme]|uniref:Nitronate monooxygenase domain-containing protein n=1 Tax=Acrodontium crateriforme TaxID=150365 RepID=A0AAQ3M7V6_9PEZI|nr:Hypothetical protein R9X50_00434200 [Acrodontium crateriforme]